MSGDGRITGSGLKRWHLQTDGWFVYMLMVVFKTCVARGCLVSSSMQVMIWGGVLDLKL
jgi:hypothetical protein